MAATYILESASASVIGNTLTSITSIEVNETGKVTELSTDGAKSVQAVFIDAKTCTITINVSDASTLKSSTIRVGKNGSTTIKGKMRSAGDSMSATELTWTISESVVTDIKVTVPTEGVGSGSITIQGYDSSGDDSLIAWS
jgi:hypothetical protein